MQITRRISVRLTPQHFGERFSMLQQVTEARDPKQQAALVHSLRRYPMALQLQPGTVQHKASALKQQLLRQLGVDLEQTQRLISRYPIVLEYRAESLVRKATEQGQLPELAAAEAVGRLWMRNLRLINASTPLLHANFAQLQLLLQLYMSPADVRQLVLLSPTLLSSMSTEAVRVRLEVLQECLPDWSPQQLGAALLTNAPVLHLSPETIRYKRRIASQYMDMLATRQQQEQPLQANELGLFKCSAERYAALEYIMMQQQQQCELIVDSTTVSNSSPGMQINSDDAAHKTYMPPMRTLLRTAKHLYERLLQEHYPGFRQWYKRSSQSRTPRQSTSWNSSSRSMRAMAATCSNAQMAATCSNAQ
jgi:hypothetical protein